MPFNDNRKKIKDLDNVFKIIEKNEHIEENVEEEKMKKLKEKEVKKTKRILIIILCIFILLSIFYVIYTINENANENYMLLKSKFRKELVVRNVDETLLENYLQPGKKTIIAIWASWCGHCQNEAKYLNQFMNEYDNVNFIVISHDKNVETLKKYFDINKNYHWFIIYDTERLIRSSIDSEASTVPLTYLLDDKGTILEKIDGEVTFEKLEELYKKY